MSGLLSQAFAAGGFEQLQAVDTTTATHTPHGGAGVSVSGVWVPEATSPEFASDGEQDRARGAFHVPKGTANLTDQSAFTIDGVIYTVVSLEPGVGVTTVQLASREKRRVGGANNRLQR